MSLVSLVADKYIADWMGYEFYFTESVNKGRELEQAKCDILLYTHNVRNLLIGK